MRVNLLRYAGVYIAMALGLAALTWAFAAVFGVRLPTGLSTAIPPMIAALVEGQALARATRQRIAGREAWREAARMTVVVAFINLVVLAGVLLFSPDLAVPRLIATIAVVFVLLLGLVLLVNRVFLGIGAKSQLKASERRP